MAAKNIAKKPKIFEISKTFSEFPDKPAIIAPTIITEEMIDIRRPGTGIQPIHLEQIFGKKTTKHIEKEQPLLWDYFE